MLTLGAFGPLDWAVLAGYFAVLIVTGVVLSRRRSDTDEYFLAGHRIPVWAAALSVLATAISAATFLGAPEKSYKSDLTYLSQYIGSIIAAAIVAGFFIPVFYREKVGTVYQLLDRRFGTPSMLAASAMFLIGRTFASGAREYMAGLAGSWIIFGDSQPDHVVIAIAIMVVIGIVYTLVGGIASVIWTDVIQSIFFVGAAVIAIFVLLHMINAPVEPIVQTLQQPGPGQPSKLRFMTLGFGDWQTNFTLMTAVCGFSLISLGAFGTDHDLAQRMLTCKSARKGSWSAFTGIAVQVPVAALFMAVGLLLYIYYQRPELTGARVEPPAHGRDVFLSFIIDRMPAGVRGLMMAGLFAAGFSSFISALNAMASSSVYDFYRRFRPGLDGRHYVRVGQWAVAGWGLVLGLFAIISVYWQAHENQALIDFALNVMTFAYSGLVAVFLTAIFTRRGNNTSVIAALVLGFAIVLALELQPWLKLAFPWRMTAATSIALIVCLAGAAKPCSS
jgi:SSS family transporter